MAPRWMIEARNGEFWVAFEEKETEIKMAIGSEDSDLSGDETFDEWGKFELWSILGQWVTHVYKCVKNNERD